MRRKVRSLKKLLKDKPKARALAQACGTKYIYLWHLSQGHSVASVKLAKLIEDKSEGTVPKYDLRPDVWAA